MSAYTATIRWTRKPDEGFIDGKYSRAHHWRFDGGAVVAGSSSPSVVKIPFSDPAGVDPEEALVASLSSCHMLFFLDFARRRGVVVDAYEDVAEGVMAKRADGRFAMSLVTLKPRVTFSGEKRPSAAEFEALHHQAHDACYIANSVNFEVKVEGAADGLA